MKKNSRSESAIFNARLIAAFTFFLAAVFLATFSFAGPRANRETAPMQARSAQMAPAAFGDPDPTVPGAPRYQNFYAPDGTSAQPGSGEFNIGFDPIKHRIMTMNTGPIWRLTPPEILTPVKPECCEALWEDKSAHTTNTGLDPILWTDQKTGRTFASNSTAGANAVYAYTDAAAPFNDGDLWVEVGAAPANGSIDHETLGSGPFPASLSALSTPVNQGQMVFYCAQAGVGPASCQRSNDLGATYGPGVLTYNGFTTQCGGLHGHIHVAPDGTAWLPANQCGGKQGGAVSFDGGVTWSEFIVQKTGSGGFTASSQSDGADPSIGIDSASTAYYCYVNKQGNEGHVHVAVGKRNGQSSNINWIRDVDIGATHGIINAAETEAVGGSAGRAACGFIGTNVADSPGSTYENGNFSGVWYAYIATTYDEGQTWVTVNATPNDPVQNHTGIWQQGGSGENGDRNLLDFNEITIDDHGRVLYGYSDGCHTDTCIHGNNLGSGQAPNVDRGPYLERGAFMRVARQIGGKPLLAQFDPSPAEPIAPKGPCLSATRDCQFAHLTWKAPDNGGADITGYQIIRADQGPSSQRVIVANTGNTSITYDDPIDPSVREPIYFVKGINSQGVGSYSNLVVLPGDLIATNDTVTTQENQSVKIGVLANDCGVPPLTVAAVNAPNHGTATVNADNTVTYTPANGYFGPDSFTYTATSSAPAQQTATVHVTVNPLCLLAGTGNFVDDFESGAPGWTVETPKNNIPASHAWMLLPDPSAHSATHSFESDTTTLDLKDDLLISPVQKLSSTSHLKFWHRYQFEDGFDGGAVEVSTDGGVTWVDVLAGGGNFITGGYNGHISPSYGSPIAGRPAWTGGDASAAMSQVDIDLAAFAGLNVRVRFHTACDMFLAGSLPGVGWFIDDVQFTNTLTEGTACPTVVSRKTHGTAGTFDIDLTNGNGVECRSGGANGVHTLVFTFPLPLSNVAGASVTGGTGTVASSSIGNDSHQYIVNLSGVANAQRLTVTLNGVTDAAGNTAPSFSMTMGVLAGDTTANGIVNSSDISQTQSQSGQTSTSANFREDVTVNGLINSSDISFVQSKSGTALP